MNRRGQCSKIQVVILFMNYHTFSHVFCYKLLYLSDGGTAICHVIEHVAKTITVNPNKPIIKNMF